MHDLPRGPRRPEPEPEAPARARFRHLPALSFAVGLLLSFAPGSFGEIFRWTDEAGGVHFSDNLHSIPAKYRKQMETRSDSLPPAPPQAAAPERPGARVGTTVSQIPLERAEWGYVVRVRINERETARLVLDTGATATALSPRVIGRLGLAVRRDPLVTVRTAGGPVQAGWTRVDSLEVGGRRVAPLDVLVFDAVTGADGLLGMDFLGAFRVEIHAQGPTLTLSPL